MIIKNKYKARLWTWGLMNWGLGLGIGDWGLGIGDWAQSPIPNPQSPIPNPQSPIYILIRVLSKFINRQLIKYIKF